MKNKRKEIFAVGGTLFACAVVLVCCLIFGRQAQPEFSADAQNGESTESWVAPETSSKADTGGEKPTTQRPVAKPDPLLEDYPKVQRETAEEVVIDFTPPEQEISQPQEPVRQEVVTTEQVTELEEEYVPADTYVPEPDGGGGRGETYIEPTPDGVIDDPVFGKVYAGEAAQEYVDSDGDPEKQVGTM